ncbi:MAG: response regulator [Nevskia sp.]|nr:response regulator [Nevskia sp.]
MKLLIVEDDPDIRKLFSMVFTEAGFTVFTADDGLDGLKMARKELPDAILMDLMMPRMNGYIATRMIKTDADMAHIPVVALTAVAPAPEDAKLKEMGFTAYCVKPVRPADAVAVIRQALGKGDVRRG